jgi:hypothetical protein
MLSFKWTVTRLNQYGPATKKTGVIKALNIFKPFPLIELAVEKVQVFVK